MVEKMMIPMNRPSNQEGENANNSFDSERKKQTAHQTNWRTKPFHAMHATVKFSLWFSFHMLRNEYIERMRQTLCDLCLCVRACKRISRSKKKRKKNKKIYEMRQKPVQLKLNGLKLLTYATKWYNATFTVWSVLFASCVSAAKYIKTALFPVSTQDRAVGRSNNA